MMNYHFSEQLDLEKLQEFYDGDPLLAVGVFEAFVEDTVPALPQLDQFFNEDNVVEFRRLVHKIKPGFLYVGLTSLCELLTTLEKACEGETGTGRMLDLYTEVQAALKSGIPCVELELEKMKGLQVI